METSGITATYITTPYHVSPIGWDSGVITTSNSYTLTIPKTTRDMIFEYIITFTDEYGKVGIIVPLTHVIADNVEKAKMKATLDIPAEYVDDLDDVEIHIKNF